MITTHSGSVKVTKESTQMMKMSFLLRVIAISLAAVHTWAAAMSQSMNADGVSYLDMGDAFIRGDWQTAINSMWSPMYAWILGLVMRLVKPTMAWEFPTVHLVNFGIFLVALLSFEFFWRQVMAYHRTQKSTTGGRHTIGFPDWALWSIGYLLFITSSLVLIEIWAVTPDLLMSVFVYIAGGIVIRFRMGHIGWADFAMLGLVLGMGYLAKSIMFPVTILFLGISLFSTRDLRSTLPRVLVSAGTFLLLAIPLIAIISWDQGQFTLGEAGTFTYAKHVNGVAFSHWQGETPGNGTPTHPSRQILDEPAVYEFGTPVAGTYPIAFDPSYWYEGLEINFNLRQQLTAIITNGLYYFDVFFVQYGGLVLGVSILYLMGRRQDWKLADGFSNCGLSPLAVAVFSFYGLVGVTGRYIGVFVVLFWADLLANLHLPDGEVAKRLLRYSSVIMIISMLVSLFVFNVEGYVKLDPGDQNQTQINSRSPSWPGEVTEALQQAGLQEGDSVAVIGYGFDSFWARLGRFKIVAEMLSGDAASLWTGNEKTRQEVIQAFTRTGARVVVAEDVPAYASLPAWVQINDTNYYYQILEP